MTTTTILIKRNADRNYDRLFARIAEAGMGLRATSLSEREAAEGYAVTFGNLDAGVVEWLAGRPKDFAIL